MHVQSFLYGSFMGKTESKFENSPHQEYVRHKPKSLIL